MLTFEWHITQIKFLNKSLELQSAYHVLQYVDKVPLFTKGNFNMRHQAKPIAMGIESYPTLLYISTPSTANIIPLTFAPVTGFFSSIRDVLMMTIRLVALATA